MTAPYISPAREPTILTLDENLDIWFSYVVYPQPKIKLVEDAEGLLDSESGCDGC
jgi:hypothetical protein